MTGTKADLVGTVKDGRLVLDGSGEVVELEGRWPDGHVRAQGHIVRRGGKTVMQREASR